MMPSIVHRVSARLGVTAALLAGALVLSASPALADASSEAYVLSNATATLNSLSSVGSPAERSAKFGTLMDQFSDVPDLATSILPRAQKIQVNGDPALKAEWVKVFRDYAMATYEDQLDRYRGAALTVTGSRDTLTNGKTCSRVRTEMAQKTGTPLVIYWYLCKATAAASWKVNDVGLVLGDSEVKLAIMQRDQLAAVLQRNGGSMRKLIDQVKSTTASMRTRITKKNG